ncbi:hypothetical protein PSAC2689_30291 [Paraburkholderia sacchari]
MMAICERYERGVSAAAQSASQPIRGSRAETAIVPGRQSSPASADSDTSDCPRTNHP